ncbi:hypothetical protein [Clavibacter nebraskensis]|uniref:Uncharacterized protein n=2 Tax=Clavibacter nebraskensis TaxID=31963 RepID=A0AAI8ZFH9_9MICO|nr:hypothetical protein [Clavibacter nebraskensis]KXU19422.1 hypothetical protein VV38_14405 [Clavibacter nebraskensis]OAH19801.1 hypothetical protein A3Q38_07815 [Clavibacter nebraskensis]QKO03339.1 hypothetical protein EGX35_00140 [Clavibacter nebraskensis]QLL36509.1 hypothetical protein EGX36_00140 [Clavibacter nebraskensis]QLL36612.1 hypothetical protein EGX37_00140 [Clavibacter nebraskensis]
MIVAVLLACVPVVDLVLLVAVTIDLRGGATADWTHGLAAAYLGGSVAFGHSMVRWRDVRFAHRFAGGPAPVRPTRSGRARVRHEWWLWILTVAAYAIACALLLAAVAFVGDAARTQALEDWIARLTVLLGICTLWAVGWTIWPGPEAASDAEAAPAPSAAAGR